VLSLRVAAHLETFAEGAKGLTALSDARIAETRKADDAGLDQVDRKAAAAAGVTDADLEKLKAARLALDDRTLAVRPADPLRHARARAHFASLAAIGAPWAMP
jgi:hypothetical protein